LCPWLDPEEAEKFVKGIPGKTADYWASEPKLPPCWKGEGNREWLPNGRHYQEQMYCHHPEIDSFINPSGSDCELCREEQLTVLQRWRAHYLPMYATREEQESVILFAVENGDLGEDDAITLGEELEREAATAIER